MHVLEMQSIKFLQEMVVKILETRGPISSKVGTGPESAKHKLLITFHHSAGPYLLIAGTSLLLFTPSAALNVTLRQS